MTQPHKNNTFASNLKSRMDEVGITSAELGRKSGVAGVLIRQWTSGRVNSPGVKNLSAVAAVLGVTPSWLMDGEGVKTFDDIEFGLGYPKQELAANPVMAPPPVTGESHATLPMIHTPAAVTLSLDEWAIKTLDREAKRLQAAHGIFLMDSDGAAPSTTDSVSMGRAASTLIRLGDEFSRLVMKSVAMLGNSGAFPAPTVAEIRIKVIRGSDGNIVVSTNDASDNPPEVVVLPTE